MSKTIGKGLVNATLYADKIPEFMIGQACAMFGAASWQILASVMKMPVSGRLSRICHGTTVNKVCQGCLQSVKAENSPFKLI